MLAAGADTAEEAAADAVAGAGDYVLLTADAATATAATLDAAVRFVRTGAALDDTAYP